MIDPTWPATQPRDLGRTRVRRHSAGRALATLVIVLVAGCAATPDRPARSTLSCAEVAVERDLRAGLNDKLEHCIAGGLIAHYCSATEARLAGIGKEVRDTFTGGDVELADVSATLTGVHCARDFRDVATLEQCCTTELGKSHVTEIEPAGH